jgi:tetratricopeptide (TPR) repeat protein
VALLPALGLIDTYIFRYSLVFDHFQYLASIGPLALAGTALISKKPWRQSALCVGLLLTVGMASWQRTWVYESEDALWTDTLARNPHSWLAHNNLGSNYVLARVNLGLALLQRGQVDEAVAHYQTALKINPDSAQAHSNLGVALFQKGQLDDAVAHYQKALEISPNSAEAHSNLGVALIQKRQLDDAVAHYQKALEINPNYAEAHNNLGLALVRKGRVGDAVAQYLKALQITPNSAETHYNLGKAFVQKGLLDSAITQFQEVLRLKPDFSPAQDDLDNAESLVRQLEGNKN